MNCNHCGAELICGVGHSCAAMRTADELDALTAENAKLRESIIAAVDDIENNDDLGAHAILKHALSANEEGDG